MNGVRIEIDDVAAQRAFQALALAAQNLAPVLREIGGDVQSSADLSFRDARSPYGPAWQPLSLTTRMLRGLRNKSRARAGVGGAAQPLRNTGALSGSVQVGSVDNTSVEVSTNVAYAAVHQFGNPRNRMFGRALAPIPARPYMPLPDENGGRLPAGLEAQIAQRLVAHLRGAGA